MSSTRRLLHSSDLNLDPRCMISSLLALLFLHPHGAFVQDIDLMLVQYGPPIDHDETEEVTSRFLSPVSASHLSDHQQTQNFYLEIFNCLIAGSGSAFRNLPEFVIEGCSTTKG